MTKYFIFLLGITSLVIAGLLPFDAFAQASDLKGQAIQVSGQISWIAKFIAFISYVVGTAFAVRSLFALKGFIEKPDDNPVNRFIGFAAVSALLIFLPWSLEVTKGGMDLHTVKSAQSSSGSFQTKTCSGEGLNNVFCNLVTEISPFSKLLAVIAYVTAAALTLTGLLNLKSYGDDPSSMPLRSIVMKFVLAVLLISLPLAMNIFVSTVTGQKASAQTQTLKKPRLFSGSIK